MAFGDLLSPQLTGAANSITNPFAATGAGTTVAVGDLIVAVLGEQTSLTVTAVNDNLGNTYSAVNAGTDGGSITGRCFYSRVTNAGSLTSVSATCTASADNVAFVAAAFAGPFVASPLDVAPANNNNTDNASPFTCPATGTLSQADELVIAWMVGQSSATWSATSPLLKAAQVVSQSVADTILGYKVVSSTTTTSPEFTGTNPTASVQGTASFKKDLTQNLTPSLYDDTDSFFAPTVTPGAVDVSPSLVANDDTFFAPTVAATYDLTPSLFDDADTFFAPTVGQDAGADNISPSLVTDSDSFFAPTVTPGAVDVSPTLFSDTDSFFAPTVSATYSLTPSLHDDTDSFFAPTVTATYSISPTLFGDADAFFAPTVGRGTVDVAPSLFSDADQFFAPTVGRGTVDVAPSLFSDADQFFAPTVQQAGQDAIFPSLVSDADSFFSPTVSAGSVDVAPSLYLDADNFFAPSLAGLSSLTPATHVDVDVFYAPTAALSEQFITPAVFSDVDVFFSPLVALDVGVIRTATPGVGRAGRADTRPAQVASETRSRQQTDRR